MKEILKKYGIKPSKKLGQNFLIDKSVLKKIIEAANLSVNDIVLEIGPGLGILTIELAKKVKKVIAIEKDKKMCEILKNVLSVENVVNVEIVNNDILNAKYELPNTNYKLVANLPYYITSPVIRKFLDPPVDGPPGGGKPELMVLMVQKEVAQRICARTQKGFRGKMSILSVSVQFYADPKIVSYVSKKSFYPKPKVDSAILRIAPRINADLNADLRGIDTKKFFRMVRAGFSSKRKMLKNNLKIDESVLTNMGLNPKMRAENLSIQDWLKLFHRIQWVDN